MGFGLDIPNPINVLFGEDLGAGGSVAPDFTIKELSAQRRTIVLRGRALPYRPARWGGRQRTKITWYQGNPEATQQVLGPEETPSTFEGMWKDRFLQGQMLVNGDPSTVTSVEQAVALFEDVRVAGNPLLVQWGSVVRVGILKEFSAGWERTQDAQWSMEFEWSGRGRSKARAIDVPDENLLGKMNALENLLAFGFEDVVARFQATLFDVVEQLRENVGEAFAIVRALNMAAAAPRQLIGAIDAAVLSIVLEAKDEAARLRDSVAWGTSLASDLFGPGGGGSLSATAAVAPLLRLENDRRATAAALMGLASSALDIQRVQHERVQAPEVATVTIPEDTSFYQLSSRYYGTPDLAGFLARANGIKGTLVAPSGFVLRVPPAPAAGDDREAC